MSFNKRLASFLSMLMLLSGLALAQEDKAQSPFAAEPMVEPILEQASSNTNQAQSSFSLAPSEQSSALNSAFTVNSSEQVDFLPIEEAYQASLSLKDKTIFLDWKIADGYYLYKDRFKFQKWHDQQSQTLNGKLQNGKRIFDLAFEKELEVFYHNTQIEIASPAGDHSEYQLAVEFQGCADAGLCYPPHTLWYTVNTDKGSITSSPAPSQVVAPDSGQPSNDSWLAAIIFAFLGGLILNLMPCVFPVLSIKALSLAEASNSSSNKKLHGWSYTAGAVLSFVLIAGIMMLLKASGQTIGWGFQLQSPIFVSLLAYLFFVMGLSLAGFAEFGNRLMGVGQGLTQKSGYQGSFFTGVLACVVASPCTAPFMGSALGFALGQSPAVALSVFAALGFGMAAPFLLLSYIPTLGKYLPKPGAWMETLKQALAFPMFIAAIWLLWVLGRQAGGDAMALALFGLTLLSFALWLLRYKSALNKILSIATIALALTLPWVMDKLSTQSAEPANGFWQSYSKEKLDGALSKQQSVFINATAAWCLTCLANERIAFTEAFEKQLEQQGTLAMKADWTNYDAQITSLLQSHGRNGVPLYLFYHKGQVQILPQLLTEEILLSSTKTN
ncbi:protein-disulfide reductase DsbD [uncultured Pseudoteredinibacter sp.]|uniref:protein-disulfide reductase DsbD family protein n=1 Tax=uncultured Pseudoteredinibacter sp. TaxID=1641701 RepID=UPI002613C8E0|nr:protein-disulfide reductase DsbD [uncultured Pseudoteredinibacter sp.]